MTPSFKRVAPPYMAKFLQDFPQCSAIHAAAVFGNFGYESGGFEKLQEMKPTVAGSRGGWGWAQWTGSRRVAFEAYCRRTGKDPASAAANYAWFFLELKGPEGKRLWNSGFLQADTLDEAVVKFENAYERSGHKNYGERKRWAREAARLYAEWLVAHPEKPTPVVPVQPRLPEEEPPWVLSLVERLVEHLGSPAMQPALIILATTIAEIVQKRLEASPAVPVQAEHAVPVEEIVSETVAREAAPVLKHLTNNEPWFRSRVTWGAIISAVAGIAGIAITAEQQEQWTTIAISGAPLIGAFVTLIGRWMATKPLGK